MRTLILLTLIILGSSSLSQWALFAQIAYESEQAISNWNCKYCKYFEVRTPIVFNHLGLQGYAFYWVGFGINIVFRGTSNPMDIIRDLDVAPIQYPHCEGCWVHEGFYYAWNILKEDALQSLNRLFSLYRQPITIMGHSLGGAIAILAARDISDIFGTNTQVGVNTFGSPRIGNQNFANYINKKVNGVRYVHYADLIPHLPPLGFYLHSFLEIWYDEEMNIYKYCSGDIDGQCSNSLTVYSTDDHLLDGYLQGLI